jgi:hypothetical protein
LERDTLIVAEIGNSLKVALHYGDEDETSGYRSFNDIYKFEYYVYGPRALKEFKHMYPNAKLLMPYELVSS